MLVSSPLTQIPLTLVKGKDVGSEIRINFDSADCKSVVTRVYRIVTIDRINEIAVCTFVNEFQVKC
jgi:hypothetical protein